MPTVPEFSHIIVICNLPCEIDLPITGSELRTCTCFQAQQQELFVPCGSKLLRQTNKKGGESRLFKFSKEQTPALQALADIEQVNAREVERPTACCGKMDLQCERVNIVLDDGETLGDCSDFVFGVRWSPEAFVKHAVTVGHPFAFFSGLPEQVKFACQQVAQCDMHDIVNNRCSKLGQWLKLSRSLQADEEALKAAMPDERRRILESKRICLMKHIIHSEGYEDKELATDLEQGFSLVGEVPRSNVLLPKLLPATMTSADLANNSRKSNLALRYMTRSSGSADLDQKLWDKTILETERGWLVGPLDWDSLEEGSSVSRRFPLEQAGKVRPIDDLSQSQVNATVTCFEQATVDGPDVICAFAVFLMRSLLAAGKPTKLLGRSLDLASAYRQLAISDSSQRHAFLSV